MTSRPACAASRAARPGRPGSEGGSPRLRVLIVAHGLAPRDGSAALVGLLDRDVNHEAVRDGAMPVVLARLEEHAVAGADHLGRGALALAEPDPLGDEDRLAVRMGVPGGAGS